MTPEDAQGVRFARRQGIIVSSYAGGTVPGAASSILALPAIAAAVGDKTTILIDSGFARGSDVLKALALGANGVLLGRPPLWGLTAYGADGVKNLLHLIQDGACEGHGDVRPGESQGDYSRRSDGASTLTMLNSSS
jgi:isopentenyl diphosphate isomerase/L-lactate dehydrogenase-like FMN-dependent dehydrogenase